MNASPLRTLACALLVSACVIASADKLPRAIKARYDIEKKVIEARDFNGFKALLSDDYESVSPEGKVSKRKAAMAEIEPMFKSKSIKFKESFSKVVKKGSTYEVSYDVTLELESAKGELSFYHEIGVDTWKLIKKQWMITKSASKSVETGNVK
jgi:hypothetical protein